MTVVPTHKNWTDLKKLHEVETGAVKGVDVGKALDTYHNGAKQGIKFALDNSKLAEALEKTLATYISKLDKKKVKKDFPKFQKVFLDNYVAAAAFFKEDFKRYAADKDVYKKELTKFFGAVQALQPDKTTDTELSKFKSGPLRGLSAVGSSLKGVDLTEVNKKAADIQKLCDASQGKDPAVIEKIRLGITKLAGELATAAKAEGLA